MRELNLQNCNFMRFKQFAQTIHCKMKVIIPLRLLYSRPKYKSILRFESDDGISPLKWLSDKSKSVSCVRLLSDAIIGPLKLN